MPTKIALFTGRMVGAAGYLAALKIARSVAHPVARQVLREQVRRTVHSRVSHHLPWWGQGRNWGGCDREFY